MTAFLSRSDRRPAAGCDAPFPRSTWHVRRPFGVPLLAAAVVGAIGLFGLPGRPALAQALAASARPPGDVDGDLHVTIQDAIVALRMLAGLQQISASDLAVVDVAPSPGTGGRQWGDGRLTVGDVIRILGRAVGTQPDPWPGGPPLSPSFGAGTVGLTAAGAPAPFVMENGIIDTGQVVDENFRPLSASVYFWNQARRLLGKAESGAQGRFTFSAPAGIYQFSLVSHRTDQATGATLELPQLSLVTASIQSGVAPLALRRVSTPALFTLQGRVSSVPTGFSASQVQLIDLARQFEFAPPPTFATAPVSVTGTFTIFVPSGLYKPVVLLNRTDKSGSVAVLPNQSVNILGSQSIVLNVPAVGSLSGTITMTGSSALAAGQVLAQAVPQSRQGGGATGTISQGSYTLPLQATDSYNAAFLPFPSDASTGPGLAYIQQGLSVSGIGRRNIVLPAPPAAHSIPAWIGDQLGRPIPFARIHVISTSLNNAVAQYQMEQTASADRQGALTLTIPDGTYQVLLSPPTDLPSVMPVEQGTIP